MEAPFGRESEADNLDLVEAIMSLEEEFGIEMSEEDCERWRRGEPPDNGPFNGAPVPRHGPFPTVPGGAEAVPPPDEDGNDR